MIYSSWDTEQDRTFCHFGSFFAPLTPSHHHQKIKILKKMEKKMPGDIILLHMCTINKDHMMYGSWDIKCKRQNFLSFWAIFCPFTPDNPKNLSSEKNEKNTWKYYNFTHVYHKWQLYNVWFLIYEAQQTEFFASFGPFFPFYPKNNQKNLNFQKMKKMPGDIHHVTEV